MTSSRERLDELLLEEAGAGLSAAERAELESLLAGQVGVDRFAYERAASAFFLAVLGRSEEPMPAELRERLRTAADEL
jgi:hypothetical protein